jgi:hypothetical protein
MPVDMNAVSSDANSPVPTLIVIRVMLELLPRIYQEICMFFPNPQKNYYRNREEVL